jgi:putative tryptophan/tyrosine transport system substrate-binding protein
MMRWREFIAALGGAAVVRPLAAHAQQRSPLPVIGFLTPGFPAQVDIIDAVRQGFREAGFVEGQNVAIEFRFAGVVSTACPN